MDEQKSKPLILQPGTLVRCTHAVEWLEPRGDASATIVPKDTYGLIEYPCGSHPTTNPVTDEVLAFEAYGILWLLPGAPERHEINHDSFEICAVQVEP